MAAKISRRNLIKGLATIPVVGALGYGVYRKNKYDNYIKGSYKNLTDLTYDSPKEKKWKVKPSDKKIRVGIVGFGSRGEHLVRSIGYAHPDKIKYYKEKSEKNKKDTRYRNYQEMEDLNVEITGICDVFDIHTERGILAGSNSNKDWDKTKIQSKVKRFKTYEELVNSSSIDAIIIATPDHLHAPISIAAAKSGKHVYCEKGMTQNVAETRRMKNIVKDSGIIFQLGHQGRQTESYIKAQEAVDKGVVGKVNLIEVCTNRNDPNGAWVYPIHPKASPETIDWQQFLGPAPKIPFNKEHFFRWRCWWEYGTGLSGDLFTHEYDAINQIMRMGIPNHVISSGGIYFYKDGRTVPDVLQIACEYPDKDFTLLYSATLASKNNRGKTIMAHDGTIELSNKCTIYADRKSTKYKEKIKKGIIDPAVPIYNYKPGADDIDAISTATEKYFAERGLLYTYRNGKRIDTTHLHLKEWLDCIRNNQQPSCNIDQGFEEAITAHMGTLSYKNNVTAFWDKEKEQVVVGNKKV